MTIYMSSSSRIEKLPSSHSSESAEWKVSHEKKERDKRSFSLFGQFQRMKKKKRETSVHGSLLLGFKWENLPKSYCRYWSF